MAVIDAIPAKRAPARPAAFRAKAVRRLAPGDLPATMDLYARVIDGLPEGFLVAKTDAEIAAYLDGTLGAAFGINSGDVLQAMALVRIPSVAHPNPVSPLPVPVLPAEDWPLHSAFLENAMARPEARGRGAQRLLMDVRIAHARSAGMRWACAGIRLANRASWRNAMACGMVVIGIRTDRGAGIIGLLRATDGTAFVSDPANRRMVEIDDEAGHAAAQKAGCIGVRLAEDGRVLVYERLIAASPLPQR